MRFNDTLFWTAWCLCAIVGALYFSWRWEEKRKRGPLFPALLDAPILYQENFASGRSRKNVITRLGGASYCLRLIVTTNEVWVTSFFPFTLFTDFYDLEHRILKQNIIAVREKSIIFTRLLIIAYINREGQRAEIELVSRCYDKFKQALEIVPLPV